ncbi:MAG: hypothetical protein LBN39_08270 [Planctomycetaceae bacterium]|jgi:hypothetical protein|nr:hypothetical protein [Planctomycetaceae bacterium]
MTHEERSRYLLHKAAEYGEKQMFKATLERIAEERRLRRERGELPPLPKEKEQPLPEEPQAAA